MFEPKELGGDVSNLYYDFENNQLFANYSVGTQFWKFDTDHELKFLNNKFAFDTALT